MFSLYKLHNIQFWKKKVRKRPEDITLIAR